MESMVSRGFLTGHYQYKKVFITGHMGFKGSWLLAFLHSLGAQIKGYSLMPDYSDGLFELTGPLKQVDSVLADIRERERLKQELLSFEPDYVFHLAAQPLVRRSYEQPADTFDINVTGTANLLEAATALKRPCAVVVITTDKVYDNKEHHALYQEDDVLGGHDPYSASKACAELVVNAFRNSFFNPGYVEQHRKGLASARAGNVIGGGDWSKDRIVPDIVRSLQQKQAIAVRNPHAVRPWQHVLEPVSGYLLLGALLLNTPAVYSKSYNFGPFPDDHLTVEQLVQIAIDKWGYGQWKDTSDDNQPHEAGLLKLDISRAMNELQWKPKLNANTAIEWTMDWYKQERVNRAAFAFDQINEYLSL
jgi:CDP-glucose 4,6-dehydratase